MGQNVIALGQSYCRVDSLWVFKIQHTTNVQQNQCRYSRKTKNNMLVFVSWDKSGKCARFLKRLSLNFLEGVCANGDTWITPNSWQFNVSYVFKGLDLLESHKHFPWWFQLSGGDGSVGWHSPQCRGTLAQGSHGKQLSALGFLGSLLAVDRVWMQPSITSPSHTVLHVLSGLGSKLCYFVWALLLTIPFHLQVFHLPAYLDIKPSPPQSLTAVFSFLMLHPHFLTTFPPPTPSNYCNGLTLQGLYSPPGKTSFPPVISQHFAGPPPLHWLPSVFSAWSSGSFRPLQAGLCASKQSPWLSLLGSLYALSLSDRTQTWDIRQQQHQYGADFQLDLFSLELSLNSSEHSHLF